MNDLNMNAKSTASERMTGFVRESSVQPQPLQKVKSSDDAINSTETQKRQEIANLKSAVDFMKDSTNEQLDQTVTQLNDSLQNIQRNLEFRIDKDAGRIVISVKDKETDEIIRQIPSEEVLELARNLHKISKQASEKLEEQISKRSEQSPSVVSEGVFIKTSV